MDLKRTLEEKKEDYCKANYESLQDAKAQLLALLTEVMMDEAGFIINQSLQDCKNKQRISKGKRIASTNTKMLLM